MSGYWATYCIVFTWWLGHFISCYLKVHFMLIKYTHALPVTVYRQTDFTPKRVVVLHLHDTIARFRTGVKFLHRYNNWGELTPGWLAPAWLLWWYHVNKCRAMRGNRCELTLVRKLPRCHVNSPSLNVIPNSKSLGIKRFVSGISISFKCECLIVMQIWDTKNLNPGRFELGITLSLIAK